MSSAIESRAFDGDLITFSALGSLGCHNLDNTNLDNTNFDLRAVGIILSVHTEPFDCIRIGIGTRDLEPESHDVHVVAGVDIDFQSREIMQHLACVCPCNTIAMLHLFRDMVVVAMVLDHEISPSDLQARHNLRSFDLSYPILSIIHHIQSTDPAS